MIFAWVSASILPLCSGAAQFAVRWNKANLPYFNLWKNTGALEDGYVTGLEPATGFPRFRAQERKASRVRTLAPGDHFEAAWSVEILDTAEQVAAVSHDVAKLQGDAAPMLHREALA